MAPTSAEANESAANRQGILLNIIKTSVIRGLFSNRKEGRPQANKKVASQVEPKVYSLACASLAAGPTDFTQLANILASSSQGHDFNFSARLTSLLDDLL